MDEKELEVLEEVIEAKDLRRGTSWHTFDTSNDWDKVNKTTKELVKEFMSYLGAIQRSHKTREKYLHNLMLFSSWVLNERDNKHFYELTKRDYMAWMNYLSEDLQLSPNRVAVLRSTVSSLSNYCEQILADEVDEYKNFRNLILKIPAPAKGLKREKTFLSEEQIATLLKTLEDMKMWREALYVSVTYITGMRASEVAQLSIDDFKKEDSQNGRYITHPIRVKSRGVSGKLRKFKIPCSTVDKYLIPYLESRNDKVKELFVVDNRGQINPAKPSTFNDWCERFEKILQVPVYPHAFRASIATNMKESGLDVNKVKTLLGHSSLEVTNCYLRPTDDEDVDDLYDSFVGDN